MTTTAVHKPSRACHLRGCPEPACRKAHLRYCKQYHYDTVHNGRRTVDATPYIAQIRALVEAGWANVTIASQVGISATTVAELSSGESRTITRRTAELLDKFQAPDEVPNWWVDATGTVRRLRALAFIGWPQYLIARELGLSYSGLRAIISGRRRSASPDTANATAELYARWVRKPGPSPHAAGRARANSWHGPMAWDDIDDPNELPEVDDLAGLEAPTRHRLSRDELAAERREWIKRLAESGQSTKEIAARLGMSVGTVRQVRREQLTGKKRNRTPKKAAA